jgi:hypothetical protein
MDTTKETIPKKTTIGGSEVGVVGLGAWTGEKTGYEMAFEDEKIGLGAWTEEETGYGMAFEGGKIGLGVGIDANGSNDHFCLLPPLQGWRETAYPSISVMHIPSPSLVNVPSTYKVHVSTHVE